MAAYFLFRELNYARLIVTYRSVVYPETIRWRTGFLLLMRVGLNGLAVLESKFRWLVLALLKNKRRRLFRLSKELSLVNLPSRSSK